MGSTIIFGLCIAIGLCESPTQTREFTLTTTQANTVSSRSSIDMPGLTGNPLAIILATPVGKTALLNPHPIGAWYYSGKWYIFNSDHANMPVGSQYQVQFFPEPGPNQFMHLVTPQNLGSEGSYIDNPALNKNPTANVRILQNYAPEVRTPYSLNRHEAKVAYSSAAGRWYIANKNGEPILKGTVYNVFIDSQAQQVPGAVPARPPLAKPDPGGTKEPGKEPKPPVPPGGTTGPVPVPPGDRKLPGKPPTEAEIMERVNKANEKLNEIKRDVTNLGGTTSTNPGGAPNVSGTARRTGFDPKIHGFAFGNDFQNTPFAPPVNVVTKGLCGGMSYTVLDFFLAGVQVPKQNYRPSHSFPLQSYIYRRQETSLVENVLPWVTYHNNPFGAKNLEIFNWGLREQLAELRTYIDRGVPVPLGLKGTGGDLVGKDHQVLAIGYNMGRYKGDVGQHVDELKIYLCEPNHPKELITMVVDADKMEFYYVEHPDTKWRSYFVDRAYRARTPPAIATPVEFQEQVKDDLVHAFRLEFKTGGAELRGGSLHLNMRVVFLDGTSQSFENISKSGRWVRGYTETVEVVLTTPRRRDEIRFYEFRTNATTVAPAEWWILEAVSITAIGGGFTWSMPVKDFAPLTFVGNVPLMVFPK